MMYKPLKVALPSDARPGDSWRLCLAVDQKDVSLVLDLAQPEFGRLPFPVTSLPIAVIAGAGTALSSAASRATPRKSHQANKAPKAKAKTSDQNNQTLQHQMSKQEKIERYYLLPAGPHTKSGIGRGTLRITEQTSFELDKVCLILNRARTSKNFRIENMVRFIGSLNLCVHRQPAIVQGLWRCSLLLVSATAYPIE
jgi:hypothetical protein